MKFVGEVIVLCEVVICVVMGKIVIVLLEIVEIKVECLYGI